MTSELGLYWNLNQEKIRITPLLNGHDELKRLLKDENFEV